MRRWTFAPNILSAFLNHARAGLGTRRVRALAIISVVLAIGLPALLAGAKEVKPARMVAGVVSDENENPISGAVVVLTDLQTGKKSAAYTGADGAYQYGGLEVTRDYEIQASYKGLSSQLRKVSSVDPRKRVTVNLRIPPLKDE